MYLCRNTNRMKKLIVKAGLAALLLSGVIFSLKAASSSRPARQQDLQGYFAADTLRQDPVCNMKVDDKKGDTIHYKGHIFGFCSKGCRASFVKAPDSFLPKKN